MASTSTSTSTPTVSAAVAAFREVEGSQTKKLENTTKRDFLTDLEKKYQKEWQEAKVFEVNSPSTEDASLQTLSGEELREKYPKFFGTFPYPYMNGSLHLGHGFTISKIEFATGFERMLGKRALFPVGYHCTGMPIKSSADKLIREMEMFGQDFEKFQDEAVADAPADLPTDTQPVSSKDAIAPTTSATTGNVDKSKKSKVNAKATGLTYQFQIMESIGVSREEIKKFADPAHWIDYFPPICQSDLTSLGARVDWRRSFVTTDVNPYYDSFVRWQINKLRELEFIKYGKRHTIYSPKDGQPCMDHDRQSGEAVGPQEYTALKMEVKEWAPAAKDLGQKTQGKKVFMVAATLRPETMYGQTNCFVGVGITYGLYEAADGESLYLITERSARNMAFQDTLLKRGEISKIAEVKGADLIGTRITAPASVYGEVYVLPMDGVSATKGTGVVTSVPSDSPDDYATYMDLRKKPEFYKIEASWVEKDIVPVISTPNYGDKTAEALCKKMKINSQKDVKQLAEAKEIAYKEGFYQGTMVIGDYKGETVEKAKIKCRNDLIKRGVAFDYQEPLSLVMSRSNDECVVALVDQWYMDYGSAEWKPKAEKLLGQMNTYNKETRNAFEGVLDWLRQWACARSYGLGSKVPFDKSQLVESLSDSTIYMAYYTIAHLLHGGDVKGRQVGPLGIKPEDLTDATWDYIFGRAGFPADATISKEQGEALRREYTYFYPMDIRSSGKDLIPNHLTFCIYVHSALFPESMWPRSMRANGHLLLNGKKMSKSTGNSLTLKDSVKKFGADATRLALADAGDAIEDANFDEDMANSQILRLYTFNDWCQTQLEDQANMRTGEKNFWDRGFEAEINRMIVIAKQSYIESKYKDALKYGFFELLNARDEYQLATGEKGLKIGMHKDLVFTFIRFLALATAPITPHFSEHLWKAVLKETSSVQTALFPEPTGPVDQVALDSIAYVRDLVGQLRQSEIGFAKKKAKGKQTAFDPSKPKSVRLFIAKEWPHWQTQCLDALQSSVDAESKQVDSAKLKQNLAATGLLKEKRAMPFCMMFARKVNEQGLEVFHRTTSFDEIQTIELAIPYIQKQLGLQQIELSTVEEGLEKANAGNAGEGYDAKIIEASEPGSPATVYFNV